MPFSGLLLSVTQGSSPSVRGATCSGCQWGRAPAPVGSRHALCPGSEGTLGGAGRAACNQTRAVAAGQWEVLFNHKLWAWRTSLSNLLTSPFAFVQPVGEGWRKNAFGCWLIYCYITYCTIFRYDRSQSSGALKMPLKSFCQNFNWGHLS